MMGNIAANVVGNLATDVLPGNDETETSRQLLENIHRTLEKLLSVTIAGNQPRRDYVDMAVSLPSGVADFNIDAHERGFQQIAFYSPVALNILLRRPGPFDLAVALPAGKFVTIQQPTGTVVVNNSGSSASIIVRFSDIVFGTVLP